MHLNKKISPLDNIIYSHYRIVHALRITLAFILTFMIVRLMDIPEGTWPLITLVVVMGPMSFWGNVTQRVLERIAGTVFGSLSGLIALWLELYSLPLMLIWCCIVMFISGYLTLGKSPYMALLIGVTLAVVCGAGAGDMHTALWRSADVILGSLLALLFASIYPQRAFIHWRMQMGSYFQSLDQLYSAWLSPNMIERPQLERKLKQAISQMVRMRALFAPASKESHVHQEVFGAIQTLNRSLLCTLEMLADAYWSSRESHFIMLNARTLRSAQLLMHSALESLSNMLLDGLKGDELSLTERLNESALELKKLMRDIKSDHNMEAPIYGYVWLSMQFAEQLNSLGELIEMTLRKEHKGEA